MKKCIWCKNEMPDRTAHERRLFFCNRKCSNLFQGRNKVEKKCIRCNGVFLVSKSNIKRELCKASCQRDRVFKNCILCGEVFTDSFARMLIRKFCSVNCSGKFQQPHATEKAAIVNVKTEHPTNTRLDGYRYSNHVAEHRTNAEFFIGRPLKRREIVHHWDENPSNNERDNLCVLRNQSAHMKLHFFARRHNIKVIDLKFEQTWLASN